MTTDLLFRLEHFLKHKENIGESLPDIRFFDGTQKFSTLSGEHKSETLDVALDKFLNKKGF